MIYPGTPCVATLKLTQQSFHCEYTLRGTRICATYMLPGRASTLVLRRFRSRAEPTTTPLFIASQIF